MLSERALSRRWYFCSSSPDAATAGYGGSAVKSLAKQAVELDRMIHEPARLALMALLYKAEEADFLYLLRESGLTKGNLQSHLARLESGDYVAIEKSFVGTYKLRIAHFII